MKKSKVAPQQLNAVNPVMVNDLTFKKLDIENDKDLSKYEEILFSNPQGYDFFESDVVGRDDQLQKLAKQLIIEECTPEGGVEVSFEDWRKDKRRCEVLQQQSRINKKIRDFLPELLETQIQATNNCYKGKNGVALVSDAIHDEIKYTKLAKSPTIGVYTIQTPTYLSNSGKPKNIGFIGIIPLALSGNGKPTESELAIHLKPAFTNMGLGGKITKRFAKEFFLPAYKSNEFEENSTIVTETSATNKNSQKMQKKIKALDVKPAEVSNGYIITSQATSTLANKVKLLKLQDNMCCR